jgi:hypothetical protein
MASLLSSVFFLGHKNYTVENGDLPYFSSNIGPVKTGIQKDLREMDYEH